MKVVHDNKEYEYVKGMLRIDGQDTIKKGRRFTAGEKVYTLRSSLLDVKFTSSEGEVIILYKGSWWQRILVYLPFLYFVVGIFGGAIGGGLSAAFAIMASGLNAIVVRSNMNIILKVITCVITFIIGFLAWLILYMLAVGAIMGMDWF